MTSDGRRHGNPEPSRNDKYEFDKYRWPEGPCWPSGLEIHIYDDGRVKVGGQRTSAVVLDVSAYRSVGRQQRQRSRHRAIPARI